MENNESVEVENQPNESPFDSEDHEAAINFKHSLDLFMSRLQKIESKSSLARVLREIAEFPLASSKPTFNSKRQEDLFLSFLALSEYKNQILTAILQKGNLNKGEITDGEEQELAKGGNAQEG